MTDLALSFGVKNEKTKMHEQDDDLANCELTVHQIVGERLTMSDSTFLNSGLVLMQPSSAKPVVRPEIEQDSALSPILALEIAAFSRSHSPPQPVISPDLPWPGRNLTHSRWSKDAAARCSFVRRLDDDSVGLILHVLVKLQHLCVGQEARVQ